MPDGNLTAATKPAPAPILGRPWPLRGQLQGNSRPLPYPRLLRQSQTPDPDEVGVITVGVPPPELRCPQRQLRKPSQAPMPIG